MKAIEQIVAAVSIILLLFNMTQRKSLSWGEKKRYASFYAAGISVIPLATAILIRQKNLTHLLMIPAIALAVVLLFNFRSRIFIFSGKCSKCGGKIGWRQRLYYDEPVCESCNSSHENIRDVADVDWDNWEFTEKAVLGFIVEDGMILLINKKTGLGAGKVNGPGGRIEPSETPEQAVVRELIEEVKITPVNPVLRGELSFIFTHGYSIRAHVFFASEFTGESGPTAEAEPFWCPVDSIPWAKMWEDDKHWLPHAIAGKYINGKFIFSGEKMLSKSVEVSDV